MNTDKEIRHEDVKTEQSPTGDTTYTKKEEVYTNQTDDAAPKGKDESESYMDYNGNSEQNAPAKNE